jgi:hypothetical protein
MTRFGFPDVENAYLMKKQTIAELREIGRDFDDDPEAAIQELLDVTSRPDHEILPMKGIAPRVELSTDEVELMNELDRLVPDSPDGEIHHAASDDLGGQKRISDEEILASFSLASITADADREFGQLPRSASEPTVATAGTTEQGHSTAPAGDPKPRALRRRHPPPEKSKSSPVLPEQRGIVTRNRPRTSPKTPER